jgi:LPS-assembly protein
MVCQGSRILAFLALLAGVFLGLPCRGICAPIDIKKQVLPRLDKDESAPIHIQADSLTYDRKEDQYIAEGRVEIVRGGMTLRADRVVLDNKSRLATAEGNVEIFQEESRLQGTWMEVNIDDQTGRIRNGTLFFEPYNLIVRGDEFERLGEDRYRVKGAVLSTCEGEAPDWRFTARELELTVEGIAEARHATFDVRNLPLLYLPYLAYPVRTQRKSGFLLPEYRSDSRVGYGLSVPFFWAIDQSWDATFTQTYFTKRGYQQGVEVRYAPWENLHGTVEGEFIYDQEEVDAAINNRGGPRETKERWRVRMDQEAKLPLGIVSRANVDAVSDNYYLEDFSTDKDDRHLRYLTSIANATKRWDSYLAAGEVRYFRDLTAPDNDNRGTPQRLPALLFNRAQVPLLGLPLSFGWNTRFDHLWRERRGTGEILDIAPGVSLPLHLGPHLSLVPFGSWQERVFLTQGQPDGGENGHFSVYRYGASLSTEVARVFPVEWTRVTALKHTLRPELRFDAVGHSLDGDFPEDFMERVPHDRLVSLALTQFLTGKLLSEDGSLGYRELVRLRIVQSYSVKDAWNNNDALDGDRDPIRPLFADLELRLEGGEGRRETEIRKGPWLEPRRYVNMKLQQLYDWNEWRWDDVSATVGAGDDRGDELSLSYRWVRQTFAGERVRKQIQGNLGVRTISTLDLMGHAWYDQDTAQWIRYGYGVVFHPACWAVRFVHFIEPAFLGRPTDHSFRLQIYLLGLGEVGKF